MQSSPTESHSSAPKTKKSGSSTVGVKRGLPEELKNADIISNKKVQELEVISQLFWDKILKEMNSMKEADENFNKQPIPLTGCENIVKHEIKHNGLDMSKWKIETGAVCALSKASELLVMEMALRSYACSTREQNEIKASDVVEAVLHTETYDLFIDHADTLNPI